MGLEKCLSREIYIYVSIVIYLLVFNLSFYASNIINFETYNVVQFLSLVFLNPFMIVVCGIIYGLKYEFSWFVPILLTLLYIPPVFIFSEACFLFYLPIYFIFFIASEIFGISISKINEL